MRILPPAIVDLHVRPPEKRAVHLWLPVFLLWPLLLIVGVLAIIVTALTDAVLIAMGHRYHHYTVLLVKGIGVLNETHGMSMTFRDRATTVEFTVL